MEASISKIISDIIISQAKQISEPFGKNVDVDIFSLEKLTQKTQMELYDSLPEVFFELEAPEGYLRAMIKQKYEGSIYQEEVKEIVSDHAFELI